MAYGSLLYTLLLASLLYKLCRQKEKGQENREDMLCHEAA